MTASGRLAVYKTALQQLLKAADGVVQFDWTDNDQDAVASIKQLNAAITTAREAQRLAGQP